MPKNFAEVIVEHIDIVCDNYKAGRCTRQDRDQALEYLNGLIDRLWLHYRRIWPAFTTHPKESVN